MYQHHNPELAQPIIDRLIKALGSTWTDSSYGNDCCASVSTTLTDGNDLTIHVPNAAEDSPMDEEFAEYSIGLDGEHIESYTHESEVIAKAKEIIDRRDNEFNRNLV